MADAGRMAHAIHGGTRTAGVIGYPVSASRSPAMHNAAFAALGLDWRYLAFEVADERVPDAVHGAVALGFAGLNVTAPHKAIVATLVDRLDPDAAVLGLVNTVVFAAGETVGYSTDGPGFLEAARDAGVASVAGLRAVVLGAGGAGTSVAAALDAGGARVTLLNRDPVRLTAALEVLAAVRAQRPSAPADQAPAAGHALGSAGALAAVAAAGLVVNAIPPEAGPPRRIVPALAPTALVCDLAYEPQVTPFLAATAGACRRQWNGLGMLLHQGARSQRLWTGREAPLRVMAEAIGYRLPPQRPHA
ncbi:MAG: shikimate dehydrogenase [Candidatus Eiseniibacteriota bacterium]